MSLRYGNHHFDARHPQVSFLPRKRVSHSLLYLLIFGIPNDTRACRLQQVSGQCYTLSTSKHMSILSDHGITTACVSGICYLKKLVIFWCQAWVHMMSDCQTTHIFGAAATLRYTASPLPVPVSTVPMKRMMKAWHSTNQLQLANF